MRSGVQKRTVRKRQAKSKSKPDKFKISRTHKPDDMGLEEWQRLLRKQYGEQQDYKLENTGGHPFFSEFLATNPQSGKTYKIAVRGNAPGDNFCSCPDFGINNLGTCKHIEFALSRLMKKRGAKKAFKEGSNLPYSEVYLRYGVRREIGFKVGNHLPDGLSSLVKKYFNKKRRRVKKRAPTYPTFSTARLFPCFQINGDCARHLLVLPISLVGSAHPTRLRLYNRKE